MWPEQLGGNIYKDKKAIRVWGNYRPVYKQFPSPTKPRGLPAGLAILDPRP